MILTEAKGAMILLLLTLEKDRFTVNRISHCLLGRPAIPDLGLFRLVPVCSFWRTGSKYGSHVVLLAMERGPSWIVRLLYLGWLF